MKRGSGTQDEVKWDEVQDDEEEHAREEEDVYIIHTYDRVAKRRT